MDSLCGVSSHACYSCLQEISVTQVLSSYHRGGMLCSGALNEAFMPLLDIDAVPLYQSDLELSFKE